MKSKKKKREREKESVCVCMYVCVWGRGEGMKYEEKKIIERDNWSGCKKKHVILRR